MRLLWFQPQGAQFQLALVCPSHTRNLRASGATLVTPVSACTNAVKPQAVGSGATLASAARRPVSACTRPGGARLHTIKGSLVVFWV